MNHPHVILGVSDSINSGATVVIDGRVVAAVNEERLNRIKMATGWPRLAIEEALRISGVDAADVDRVAVATKSLYWRSEARAIDGYFDADWGLEKNFALLAGAFGSRVAGDIRLARRCYYGLKRFLTRGRRKLVRRELRHVHRINAPVEFVDHHTAHAASAYYTSGRPSALIVTLDGAGDDLSATVSQGRAGSLTRVHNVDSYDSVGNYYSYVTHLLGFKAHKHEGKITGLAAYGIPLYADTLHRLICYKEGSICNRGRAFHTAALKKLRRLLPESAEPRESPRAFNTYWRRFASTLCPIGSLRPANSTWRWRVALWQTSN